MQDMAGALYGMLEVVGGVVFIFVAGFVLSKDPKYDLNRLVCLAFLCFSVTLLSEGLLYVLQSSDPVLINLLRDLTEIGGLFAGAFILLAGIHLSKGKEWRSFHYLSPIFAFTLLGAFFVQFEHVRIQLINNTKFYYYVSDFWWSFVLISLLPVLMLVLSFYMFNTVRRGAVKTGDSKLAQRMLLLQVGMVLIIVSAPLLVLQVQFLIPTGTQPNLALIIPGQLGYLASSFTIFLAFK